MYKVFGCNVVKNKMHSFHAALLRNFVTRERKKMSQSRKLTGIRIILFVYIVKIIDLYKWTGLEINFSVIQTLIRVVSDIYHEFSPPLPINTTSIKMALNTSQPIYL